MLTPSDNTILFKEDILVLSVGVEYKRSPICDSILFFRFFAVVAAFCNKCLHAGVTFRYLMGEKEDGGKDV